MKHNKLFLFFALFTGLSFLGLLLYIPQIYAPFQSGRVLFLCAVVELLLPFYLFFLLHYKQLRPKMSEWVVVLLLLFCVAQVVSLVMGDDLYHSLWGRVQRMGGFFLYTHFVLLFFYLLLIFKAGKKWGLRIVEFFVLIATAVAIHAILEGVGLLAPIDPQYAPRVVGLVGNPALLASFFVIPLFLSAYIVVSTTTRWRLYVGSGAFFLLLTAIIMTGTRGAFVGIFIALFVGLVTFLITSKQVSKKKLMLIGLIMLIVGGGLFAGMRYATPEDSLFYRLSHYSGGSSDDRIVYWQIGLRGWLDNLFLGYGPENYYRAAERYYEPHLYAGAGAWPDKPHNYYIEILATGGILSFFFYSALIGVIYYLIVSAWKRKLLSRSAFVVLLAGLTAHLVQNIFLFETLFSYYGFFLLLALVASLHYSQKKKISYEKRGVFLGVALVSLFVPIFLIYQFLIPIGQQYVNVYRAFSVFEEDQNGGVAVLDAVKEQRFVHDYRSLALNYYKFLQNASLDPGNSMEFLDEIGKGGIDAYQKCLAREPKVARYWEGLASMYLLNASIQEAQVDEAAIEAVKRSNEITTARIDADMVLASIYRHNSEIEKALDVIERVLQIAPDDSGALWVAASIYHELGMIDQAVDATHRSFVRGMEILEDSVLSWLVEELIAREEYAKLVELFESVITNNSDRTDLLVNLAVAYTYTGEYQKANETALRILEHYPDQEEDILAFIESLEPYLE
jgi:O-antigen ligase/tetratricopeptide (TPR) repeat protein